MSDERYILKPLTSGNGRGYRSEIDEFIADNEMTNLFLIALSEMQKDSLRKLPNGLPDWLTYYSLAGIHGQPRDNWNDYPNEPGKSQAYGYCHHSMNTFPTWHRPYMLLYEAVIHREMVKQANLYEGNDKTVYLDAAARFRLPYWDLIMPRNKLSKPAPEKESDPASIWGCPEILKARKVFVKLPKGDPAKVKGGFWEIDNPLAYFTFPDGEEFTNYTKQNKDSQVKRNKLVFDFKKYNKSRTARIPTLKSNQETDDTAVDTAIQRQAGATANMLWQMLLPDQKAKSLDKADVSILINEERPWESFANNSVKVLNPKDGRQTEGVWIDRHPYATVSLESFHDGIHVLLGTSRGNYQEGQMGNPALAAFDPIFWLHHNNIERLLCLQQALYPQKWTNAEDSEIELFPFMTGKGRECYKSSDKLIKNYWSSGFSIPGGKEPQKSDDPAALKDVVTKYLDRTYYWATNIGRERKTPTLSDWPKTDDLSASWALKGINAIPNPNKKFHSSVITRQAGVPNLALRDVAIEEGSPQVEDNIITTSQVVKKVQDVDSSLPEGAFTGPPNAKKPPIQITWNAHVRVRKFAFNGSFSIHLFIGHVKDEQPERYMTKKNEAGFMGVFASSADSGCASCKKNQEDDILVEDVIPLTTILYDYLDASAGSGDLIRDGDIKTIPDLAPESVVPFLKEHLKWRMINLDSSLLVEQEQEAKLEVLVTSRQFLTPSEEHLMGVYGPYTPYAEVTNTKAGGFGYTY